ncbi:UV-damaged DNA-binding protein rad7 [Coemansia sp. RSA 552]|nr:UV-damaged DNA-binding protein rad7 [Coemansia sp. RSA 552]
MDPNDRTRGGRPGNAAGKKAKGTIIKGPNSALTDYLQEIGVTEHFRERRRREAEERARAQEEAQARQQANIQPVNGQPASPQQAEESEMTADAALAVDMQQEEQEAVENEAGPSTSTGRPRRAAAAGSYVEVVVDVRPRENEGAKKNEAKKRGRKKRDEGADEAEFRGGLTQSSARKGGKMKECEMCGRRFLVRGEEPARLLCAACRRSVDKAARGPEKVPKGPERPTKRGAPRKRRKMRKTEGGLLEIDPDLPTLQDLCVRAIARHVDLVETFGDIGGENLNRLCRVICKKRELSPQTMRLFATPERTALTLYDCTRLTVPELVGIPQTCMGLESLDLQFCGRLDGATLLSMADGLPRLAHVRLDGAFLVTDGEWAAAVRSLAPRLRSLSVAWASFGICAMRAVATHCMGLERLCVDESTLFNDDCLATLTVPITEEEEIMQEAERGLADSARYSPAWQPLERLRALQIRRPSAAMETRTAKRVVRQLGRQLETLDFSGFRDLADDFLGEALLEHGMQNISDLRLAGCDAISPQAFADFFLRARQLSARAAGDALTRLDLGRCYMLTDRVVQELVQLSGATLRSLCLNSVDDNLTVNGLLALAGFMYRDEAPGGSDKPPALAEETMGCVCLEDLDVSWVRCTSDSVLRQILPKCRSLKRIRVYGCPSVSAMAPARPGLAYVGRESDTL